MADSAYFIKLDQPSTYQTVSRVPYCHIAGAGGAQPGVGDMLEIHTHLFRIFRDVGYRGAISCACPWVSTDGGPLNFGRETAKALRYVQDLRNKVYSE
jgi:hypothetical protein